MFDNKQRKTIGVKIGTAALSNEEGLPDLAVLSSLAEQLAEAKAEGHRVFLVSSGAVGVGRKLLGWGKDKKLTLREKQIASKRGQPILMATYESLFAPYNMGVTQSLFERHHFGDAEHAPLEDMAAPFFQEIAMPNIIPIINENDGVATHELKCTDNDEGLSLFLGLVQADTGIILSNVRGVFTGNPNHGDATFVPLINFSDSGVWDAIDTTGRSSYGLGGMKGKLHAANDFLCACGDERKRQDFLRADCGKAAIYIASSREPNVIRRILAGDTEAATKCVCRPAGKSSPFCRYWQKTNGCSL